MLPKNKIIDGILTNFSESEANHWNNIVFIAFDMPNDRATFDIRLKQLKTISNTKHFKIHEFIPIQNIEYEFDKVNNFYIDIMERGGKGLMLIQANSYYKSGVVNSLLSYREEFTGTSKIVGFVEGMKQYYKYLGKFKCETPDGKLFYCSKDIPDDIRKKYHFEQTKLTFIEKDVPRIGDILYYKSKDMIKGGVVPRDAIYTGFATTPPPPQEQEQENQ
jgi:ATP-dependent DNA ligase